MSSTLGTGSTAPPAPVPPVRDAASIKAKPARRPGRWIGTVAILYLAFVLARFVITSDGMRWDVVREYLFDPRILHGAWTTVYLSILTMVIAIVLGVLLAVTRMSDSALVRGPSQAYIWFFRGTPVLVQLLLLVQPRVAVELDQAAAPIPATDLQRRHEPAHHPTHRGAPGAGPERGRLHGRDRSRRHPVGRPGSDRGGVTRSA